MIYLDSNVFIFATLNRDDPGNRARNILLNVQSKKVEAGTSALTFDEIVWSVKKHRGLEDAAASGEALLKMPGLTLIEVSEQLLLEALNIIRRYHLDPRDSIHAASAFGIDAEAIISSDKHFDKVKEIRRRDI